MIGSFHIFAQIGAERMLNCILEGSLLTLVAWVLLRAARRQNSGTRFAALFGVLVTIGILPIVEGMLSRANITSSAVHSRVVLPGSWAVYFFLVWAFFSIAGLAKLAVGFWRVRTLRRCSAPIQPETLDPMLQATLSNFRGRRVALYSSDEVAVPAAIGFLRPAILLPTWAPKEMSVEELNAVLLHELAHVQRWDDFSNLAQKILRAVFFFHPAVWWLEHKLALEREAACDDLVVAQTKNPRAYAECLVAVAEKGFLRRGIALAQAAVGKVRQTSLRLARILSGDRPVGTGLAVPVLASIAVLAVATIVSVPHVPNLIAFQNADSALSAAGPTASAPDVPIPSNVVRAKFSLPDMERTAQKRQEHRRPTGVVAAKLRQRPASRNLLRASTTRAAVPQEVVFVMETQESSPTGTQWTLCVWRLTIVQSGNGRTIHENLPNKI